jgi:exodeoxyribonuclease V gamma subunit
MTLTPGLLVLHGNRLELLRDAVLAWLERHPLAPLETEQFLVASNGVAEWLKVAIAAHDGVFAASRIDLPGRFLWQAYRAVLGEDAVPALAPLDKGPLTWRLMQKLPDWLADPCYAPLAHYLQNGDASRCYALASRLADLYDQYQVYRADWLAAWAAGEDVLIGPEGRAAPLPESQRWQARLWRDLCASLPQIERAPSRAVIHREFLDALAADRVPGPGLPRRVVLFGVSVLPAQTLEALAALSRHLQVLLAVPNPCRYHWADILDGRELLRQARRRHLSKGTDLAGVDLEAMHAHAHPLLAAWGRLGRDFLRLLDGFDDAAAAQARFALPRIDLFDEDAPADTVLARVQAAIRDLMPVAEHPWPAPTPNDDSISFHVAHSPLRELEVLHDRLLARMARPGGPAPRDIVVMVPDIEAFAPAIHAVFGQYPRGDARWIPYHIGDVRDRTVAPLLQALDRLLRLPTSRLRQSELSDLLDVPAFARRFGLGIEDLPPLRHWLADAGLRWGLDGAHRAALGLAATGTAHSAAHVRDRLLLGYANGDTAFNGIPPYDEVGGLDAARVGCFARLVERLQHWRTALAAPRPALEWAATGRALLKDCFDDSVEDDRLLCLRLDQALGRWLADCDLGGHTDPLPLAVFHEAWLAALEDDPLQHRFISGGVTFCTLMPMRAVPFRVVCLLGLNEGDYPRRAPRSDFDLMAQPGLARPGDRARRDDDRYLMLEALLAARDALHVSWSGRSVRDNREEPPSVLVAQLRDYLDAVWPGVVAARTTVYPLQPFSRRHFEVGGPITHAHEWRQAHIAPVAETAPESSAWQPPEGFVLDLDTLTRFLRSPAQAYFRQRLDVVFDEADHAAEDDEPFTVDELTRWAFDQALITDDGTFESPEDVPDRLAARAARQLADTRLPLGEAGRAWVRARVELLTPLRRAWLAERIRHAPTTGTLALEHTVTLPGGTRLQFRDWLDHVASDAVGPCRLTCGASMLRNKQGVRRDKRLRDWLGLLAAAASGTPLRGIHLGPDGRLDLAPIDPDVARKTLDALLQAWWTGMQSPLPTALATGLAYLTGADPRPVYEGDEHRHGEVERDPCLARLWPDFDALSAEGTFQPTSQTLYAAFNHWLNSGVQYTEHPTEVAP